MSGPRIGLALGAGGARGLAHVAVIGALEDVGVKPQTIAGASMGAIVGAAAAQGMGAKEMRSVVLSATRDKARLMAKVLQARVGKLADLFSAGLGNPMLLDAEQVLSLFWPGALAARFEDLALPLTVVATDFYGRVPVPFAKGPLAPALAASMAIPGIFRPVEIGGTVLVDGGVTDPLPYGALDATLDLVIACDVTGGPVPGTSGMPTPLESLLGATQIMQSAIVAEKVKALPPGLLLTPQVDGWRALDFFRAADILRAGDAARPDIARRIEQALAAL